MVNSALSGLLLSVWVLYVGQYYQLHITSSPALLSNASNHNGFFSIRSMFVSGEKWQPPSEGTALRSPSSSGKPSWGGSNSQQTVRWFQGSNPKPNRLINDRLKDISGCLYTEKSVSYLHGFLETPLLTKHLSNLGPATITSVVGCFLLTCRSRASNCLLVGEEEQLALLHAINFSSYVGTLGY